MRTDRAYRKRLHFNLAAQEMRAVAGTQLDPRVVAALLEVVADEAPQEDREPGQGRALSTSA
jgi:HD-GYP domain-containing protein (c-di-GMP phosphodiesterase class II)